MKTITLKDAPNGVAFTLKLIFFDEDIISNFSY